MRRKYLTYSIITMALIGIISAVLVYFFVYNKPHQDYAKAKPAYIVSASDLFDSFRNGRVVAEEKYNGRVVMLSGRIDKIESNEDLVTGVFVFNQGIFGDEGIRCTMLPEQASSLLLVREGTDISLKGYLTGYNETDVILEHCSIIK